MRYGRRELKKGEKIRLFSCKNKRPLGLWKYVGDGVIEGWGLKVPIFKSGKRRIYGTGCWWIPLKEAIEVEKGMKKQ